MQDKLQAISKMQALMVKQNVFPQQKIIAAIHAINLYHKLECINEKGQHCEYPQNWKQKQEDQHRFTYQGLQQGGRVVFRFRITEQKVVVTFGNEGQKQVTKVAFNKNDTMQEIVKKYEFNLNQFLTNTQPNICMKPFYHSGNVEPKQTHKQSSSSPTVNLNNFIPNIKQSYPPKNVTNLFQETNPFGKQEYVGPNSQIFHNPYFEQIPAPTSQKIPVGARYDPIDPFDNPYQDKRDNPDDFIGFDQFGVPLDPSKKAKKAHKNNPLDKPGRESGGHFGANYKGGSGGFGPLI